MAAVLASLLVYAALRRRLGLDGRGLRPAAARALETLGLTVVFLGLDLAVALAVALLARAAGRFVSLYLAVEPTLVYLALLQALVFQRWWEGGRRDP